MALKMSSDGTTDFGVAIHREGNNAWSRAAEREAEQPRDAGHRKSFRKARDKALAMWLMQAVLHRVPNEIIAPLFYSGDEER